MKGNCHPVCQYCNCVDPEHGQKYVWMMHQVYGPDLLEELRLQSKSLAKFMRHELVEKIDHYKVQLKLLQQISY